MLRLCKHSEVGETLALVFVILEPMTIGGSMMAAMLQMQSISLKDCSRPKNHRIGGVEEVEEQVMHSDATAVSW
jgi:hypothetical protein